MSARALSSLATAILQLGSFILSLRLTFSKVESNLVKITDGLNFMRSSLSLSLIFFSIVDAELRSHRTRTSSFAYLQFVENIPQHVPGHFQIRPIDDRRTAARTQREILHAPVAERVLAGDVRLRIEQRVQTYRTDQRARDFILVDVGIIIGQGQRPIRRRRSKHRSYVIEQRRWHRRSEKATTTTSVALHEQRKETKLQRSALRRYRA